MGPVLLALACAGATGRQQSVEDRSPTPVAVALEDRAPIHARSGPGRNLNLILSTATRGELLPCGQCRVKAGGLPRRAGFIQACRDTAGFVLVAEAGDLFHPKTRSDPAFDRFLIDLLARLEYSVLGVGELDLRRGPSTLKELVADHPGLEWVSANVVDSKTGEPVFAPYVLRRAGSVVIGFTSCLEPKLWEEFAAEAPEVRVESPEERLYALIPQLRAQCDLVVGLLHMDYKPLTALLQELDGIDIAVAGHGTLIRGFSTRFPFTRQLFFAGQRGRSINLSDVEFTPDGVMPRKGQTIPLRDRVPSDSTITREILAFLETHQPPRTPEDAKEMEDSLTAPAPSEDEGAVR